MPKRVGVLVLVVVAAAFVLPGAWMPAADAQHHHKKIAREEIEDMEQRWRAAQLSGDTAAMDKLLSDDYLGITGNGQVVTKLQQMDRMKTRDVQISRLDISDMKIKLIGQIAIVTSRAEIQGTSEGAPLQGSFRSTRVYQQVANGDWKLTSFEATRVRQPRAQQTAAPKS